MRETVVRVFWCSLSSLGFGCKCSVSFKSLELLIVFFFEVHCGFFIVLVVFFCKVVVQDSCCAEMMQKK